MKVRNRGLRSAADWAPLRIRALVGLALLVTGCAYADTAQQPDEPPAWPDSFVARLEALALLQTLNAELLSHDSATLTLEHWCEAHRLAAAGHIVAVRVEGEEKPLSTEQRGELAVSAQEPIRYRRVRLTCGTAVLSEADNWYVPARLTPQMNRTLESSDTPFGKVVMPLHFQRHTLSSSLLWQPLPAGWEMSASAAAGAAAGAAGAAPGVQRGLGVTLVIPAHVLQHKAVLTLPDGTPFSEVIETYTAAVLGFAAPVP